MPMEILNPKYRRDPNQKVESLYFGVAPGGRSGMSLVRPSVDKNRMEVVRQYGPGMTRGIGGRAAIFVLGGMETTLDEVQYLLEAKQQKKFVPKRGPGEIAAMCRLLTDWRNERIKHLRLNPSERPRPKVKVKRPLYLPVGARMVNVPETGGRLLIRG